MLFRHHTKLGDLRSKLEERIAGSDDKTFESGEGSALLANATEEITEASLNIKGWNACATCT